MTIQVLTQPYELLFRFADGAVSGCHYRTIEVVTDGERVYSATEGVAQPVTLGGEHAAQVIGELNTGLVQALEVATAERDSLQQAVDELELRVSEIQRAFAESEQRVQALQSVSAD